MSLESRPIHRAAVAAHPRLPASIQQAAEIAAYLKQEGLEVQQGMLFDETLRQNVTSGSFDVLIAVGGDGTMLRAGHLCGPLSIPILGINVGHFGFLIEVQHNQWRKIMPRLLHGEYWVEQRMMLRAEQYRSGALCGRWEVLNEVVVSRGRNVRPVQLTTHVDGRFLTTYVADALIASTATGSTAYALAAGGPILPPELRNILLVAVAPHLSVDRALVLAEGSSVSITVRTSHQAVLSPDGQEPIELADGDQVEARASEHTAQFIRFQDPDYFYRNLTHHMNQNPSTGDHR